MKIPEWSVQTECGRNFVWSAWTTDSLLRELTDKGYLAVHISEYVEETVQEKVRESA